MAVLYPTYESILQFKPQPTKGELRMIEFLRDHLDDDYEVFFQPFLNGDCPDIVLVRKGGGVIIIEVKDWNLESYHLDHRKRWFVSHNNALIKSPIAQVLQYKENLFNLHIDKLLELKLKNSNYWHLISCAVFFSDERASDLRKFLFTPFEMQRDAIRSGKNRRMSLEDVEKAEYNYSEFLNINIDLIGYDLLNKTAFNQILISRWIGNQRKQFTNELYESFIRYLKPSFHHSSEGKDFKYTTKQKQFSESKPGEQKIKGIVGSGKTLVLAKRAVNAHIRTNDAVLIITYNISLKNYIHDKISSIREDFNWAYFHIVNYHDFFNSVLNNLGIQFNIPEGFDTWEHWRKEQYFNDNYYGNLELLELYKNHISRYKAILIDEVQDFKTVWLRIIKRYFLSPQDGEFVVFGDGKQDIYNRIALTNSIKELTIPESPGRWAELNQSFRLTPTITAFASYFQQEFLKVRHAIDEFENLDFQAALFDKVHYRSFDSMNVEEIVDFILAFTRQHTIHPNDICVLSLSIDILRQIDAQYRKVTKEKTSIMSETQEFYEYLLKQFGDTKTLKEEIDKIRKNKKMHFWMNSGLTKLSTVHSFKGWEVNTLFLIIQGNTFEETYRELVYTGFTRSMRNLVLINVNDVELELFAKKLEIIQNW